jgi:hypothetical protein
LRIIIGFIAAGIVLIAAGLVWLLIQSTAPGVGDVEGQGGGASVDSAARIEIEALRGQIDGLRGQIDALKQEVDALRGEIRGLASRPVPQASAPGDNPAINFGPNAIRDNYAQVVLIARRREVNEGLRLASPNFLTSFIGKPRETLNDDCQEMTNPKLRAMLEVEQVGPIRVRMLRPALDSLGEIFEKIRQTDQDLYDRIDTAGSLCVRQIRGTIGRVSTHSFGLSVDLNIDGQLDTLGDGKTQLGLTILADFFREAGWVWGAGFSREDSMHFEVGRDLLEEWRADGKI